MPSAIMKFNRLLAMEWSKAIQYRFDMLLWSVTEAAVPLISLAVWYRVAAEGQSAFTSQEVITYYVFIIFINLVTSAWGGYFLSREILSGEIIRHLIRPFPVLWHYVANNLAEKMMRLAIPLPLLVIGVATTIPTWFAPAIYEPRHIGGFILSLFLAIIISFVFDLNIGVLAFWLEDVNQLRSYKALLQEITSGVMIPFILLPALLQTLFSYLPFRYIISAPAEILLGQTKGWAAVNLLGIQLAWAVGLLLLLNYLWKKGLKNYAPPGQ